LHRRNSAICFEHGEDSAYKDFFVDWNAFWEHHGDMGEDGCVVPRDEYLNKLFLRKPGLPILKVGFPDGSERPYWNTFYQQVSYRPVTAQALGSIDGLSQQTATQIAAVVNTALETETDLDRLNLDGFAHLKEQIRPILERNRDYLGPNGPQRRLRAGLGVL
jgi:sucrose phosphorylase